MILESELMEQLLTEALADSEVAVCGPKDALSTLSLFRPDTLVVDLCLPGTDGLSLLEGRRDLLPPTVLGLSRYPGREVLAQACRLGVGLTVLKPCTTDHIVNRLTDLPLLLQYPELAEYSLPTDRLIDGLGFHGRARAMAALRGSLLMILQDPDALLTKDVYPALCRDYGAGPAAVDQALRRLIRSAWNSRPETGSLWDVLFPGSTQYPATGEFLTAAAAYLQKSTPPVSGRGQRLSEGCPRQTSVNVQDN